MAKKIVSIRIDNDTLNYLKKLSFIKGFHHKLSKDIPNITKTIELIISEHKESNNHNSN